MAELIDALSAPRFEGAAFFDVHVSCGARADLGRPATSPEENKRAFMAHVIEET
jgi:hypothetical protein